MKCDQCQTENKEGAKFCAKCGAGLSGITAKPTAETKPCPACDKALKLDAKFCGGCGYKFEQAAAVQVPKVEIAVPQPEIKPVQPEIKAAPPIQTVEQTKPELAPEPAKTCPKCGKALKPDAKFCGGCGHNFVQAIGTPAPNVEATISRPETRPVQPEITPPEKIVEQIKPKFIPEIVREEKSVKKLDIPTRKGPPIAAIAGGIGLAVVIIAGGGIYYYKSHIGQTVAAKVAPPAIVPLQASAPVAVPVAPSSSVPVASAVAVSVPVVTPVVEPATSAAASEPKNPKVHAKQKGETQDDKKLLNAIDQYMDKQK